MGRARRTVVIGRLGRWWASKKPSATTDSRPTSFAVESLEPRLLLSATLGSEDPHALRVDVDPTANVSPIAAMEVDAQGYDSASDAQSHGLHLSLPANGSEETQEDVMGTVPAAAGDSQPAGVEASKNLQSGVSTTGADSVAVLPVLHPTPGTPVDSSMIASANRRRPLDMNRKTCLP
jgi:hypothetical protein